MPLNASAAWSLLDVILSSKCNVLGIAVFVEPGIPTQLCSNPYKALHSVDAMYGGDGKRQRAPTMNALDTCMHVLYASRSGGTNSILKCNPCTLSLDTCMQELYASKHGHQWQIRV
jgi:hypothetical protein